MSTMDRREFIVKSAAWVGSTLGTKVFGAKTLEARTATTLPATLPASKTPFRINDVIVLGNTGIKPSRLAMGTGTMAGQEQRALGIEGMVKLLRYGLDRGIYWWDTAKLYKIHPHVAAALKEIKRDKVIITSKSPAKTAADMKKDIENFRKQMNIDYIDIMLMHCMTNSQWPQKLKGPMDVLSEAKQNGIVRAVGCSYHSLDALKAAVNTPWVDVNLVRINPFAATMDVKRRDRIPEIIDTLAQLHHRGKAVYGMKILGQGALKEGQIDRSLQFALSKPYISGFTIGFSDPKQIDDIARRTERIRMAS